MRSNPRVELLRSVWLFQSCSRSELNTLASAATHLDVPEAKVLAHEGEPGDEFFIVVAGSVLASRQGVELAKLGPGGFFGEMALLDREPRTATVVTLEPSEVLVLSRQEFASVLETMPTVNRKILVVVARRLRELENRFLPTADRLLARDVS